MTNWTGLRLSATKSLFERRDCVIVASVSCIYGLGSPEAYYGMLLMLEKGQKITRREITSKLVEILLRPQRQRLQARNVCVRGDVIEIFPTYDESAYRIEMWGRWKWRRFRKSIPCWGRSSRRTSGCRSIRKTHYVMSNLTKEAAIESIKAELELWRPQLEAQGKLIEAQRLHQSAPCSISK